MRLRQHDNHRRPRLPRLLLQHPVEMSHTRVLRALRRDVPSLAQDDGRGINVVVEARRDGELDAVLGVGLDVGVAIPRGGALVPQGCPLRGLRCSLCGRGGGDRGLAASEQAFALGPFEVGVCIVEVGFALSEESRQVRRVRGAVRYCHLGMAVSGVCVDLAGSFGFCRRDVAA